MWNDCVYPMFIVVIVMTVLGRNPITLHVSRITLSTPCCARVHPDHCDGNNICNNGLTQSLLAS